MCGIVTVKKNNKHKGKKKKRENAVKGVLKRFDNQRQRGTEGFGYIAIENGKVVSVQRAETEAQIKEKLKKETAKEIIFHHRNPTSTPNLADMAHPITVESDLLEHIYYVIHNGVISNPDELRVKHEILGMKYTTDMTVKKTTETRSGRVTEVEEDCFNDSEAFAIELALYLSGKRHVIDTKGSIAFVCVETDKENNVLNIHYGRNDGTSPLVVEENIGILSIKSLGNGVDVPPDVLHTIDYATQQVTMNDVEIGETWKSKAGFSSNNNSSDVQNAYDKRASGDDFGRSFEDEDVRESPYSVNKGMLELTDGRGRVIGYHNGKSEESIKQSCREDLFGYDDIQAWSEEIMDLTQELEEAQDLLRSHANGIDKLSTDDVIFYQEVSTFNQEQIISIQADIDRVEMDLQNIDE